MKNVILILFLFPLALFAQQGKEGVAHYRLKLQNGLYKNAVLYFNDSASLYIYNKRGMDDSTGLDHTSMSYDSREGALKGVAFKVSEYDDEGAQVYRNFFNKSVSFRETARKPLDAFTVEDTWMEINWRVENTFKDIAGYSCQRATGSFRGRVYVVWFTRDVPLPYGPWKLFGLPGLIVKAELKHNNKELFDVELDRLCYPCDSVVAFCEPLEADNKTIREYVYDKDHFLDAVRKKFQERMPVGVTVGEGHYDQTLRERRNNRLERLFEWEKRIPSGAAPDTTGPMKLNIRKD